MKSSMSYILLTIFFILIDSEQCFECDLFEEMEVMVIPNSNNPQWKTFPKLDGCFEPKKFKTKVSSIVVSRKNIGNLGDHAVHDLLQLKTLSFFSCDIRKISSHAFENLPNLQEIWITGSKLTSIPSGTFKNLTNLELIDLQIGKISQIATDVFDVGLKQLSLLGNELTEINHHWFSNSPYINYLNFNHNKIQQITERTFEFTPNLKALYLSFNEMKHIGERTFHHLKNMEIIDLGYNRLVELDPNIVPGNFKVQTINLKCNFLNFLPRSLLEKLTVKTVVWSGNPWECACLQQLQKWMAESNVISKNYCKLSDIPHCVYGAEATVCSDKVDANITKSFLDEIRDLDNSNIDKACANLS